MISSPLNYIFNLALSTGIFPARMKYSVVKPLLKKGDKSNISNYRPISLLTSFSRILEKIIYIRLYKHLITHNILVKEQYGFRENSSTQKAIFNLLKEIINALNNKRKAGGIFCYLHKAFDCVNHEILLAKLEFYGVTGNFLRLIRSCLEHRYQRVEIGIKSNHDKVYSEWERIKHGVPQGSVLGPLFFLVYINGLPKMANTTAIPVLGADDMSVIVTSTNNKDFYNNIMSSLEQLTNWFTMNLLSLNLYKTNFVLFKIKNSPNIDLSINYVNVNVISRTDIKFLGVTSDNFLNWKVHIDNLFSKLSTSTFTIRILKQTLSQDILLMTYFAYFHSNYELWNYILG
jgi:hypothetical protein